MIASIHRIVKNGNVDWVAVIAVTLLATRPVRRRLWQAVLVLSIKELLVLPALVEQQAYERSDDLALLTLILQKPFNDFTSFDASPSPLVYT